MIEISTSQSVSEVVKNVDMNKTLLIMGKAATNNAINKIVYYSAVESVEAVYGDSDLTDAFRTAKEFGVPHVFLINVQHTYDYIEIANILRHYDFAYVVSTDIFFSDAFHDSTRNNRRVSYYQHFVERLSAFNRSVIVATDKHASLYEDIDAYLDEMIGLVNHFKSNMTGKMDGRSICFVANNLADFPFANVVLASMLCAGDLGEYPFQANLGEAVFDIDSFDVKENELVFFKNNHLSGTTVENLLNFNSKRGPEKIVTIDRIVKYVRRNLDLSRFKGKHLSPYQRLRVEKALVEYFDPLLNWILRSYDIKSIQFIREAAGVGIIVCEIDIWTINSTEKFSIIVEG